MKGETNNLQVARWTDDPAQQERFFTEIGLRIDLESRYMARRYSVETYLEDMKPEIHAELLRQMGKKGTSGPFAKDSPKEAAGFFLEKDNYLIRELARSIARKIARRQSRQAQELADVRQPDLPPDIETQLFAIAKSLPLITSEIPNLTPRDNDIVRKELLRQVGIDDLPAASFNHVARAAGVSSSEQRAYCEYYDQHGHLSPSDRKAWSRAHPKIKAFPRDKFRSLLVIVFALSLALYAIHQGRSIQQNESVNQGSFIHQDNLAHQVERVKQISLAHQVERVQQRSLAHQVERVQQRALAHQVERVQQRALAHQVERIQQTALAHQDGLVTTDYDRRGCSLI